MTAVELFREAVSGSLVPTAKYVPILPELIRGVPVTRQIGDRNLYVGNTAAVDDAGSDFDHVLTVCLTEYAATTHHQPVADGRNIRQERFETAADAAVELHESNDALLINCVAALSRSPAIAATAIAAVEGVQFDDALAEVRTHRICAAPHPAVVDAARAYL